MTLPSAAIPIHDQDGRVVAQALVDPEDHPQFSGFRWYLSAKGYAQRNGRTDTRRVTIRMHRELLGLPGGDPRQGDHINGDRLDNRRANLRVANAQTNSQNRRSHKTWRRGRTVSSSYRGVSFLRGRWQANATIAGRQHYLGLYDSEIEAAATAAAFRLAHMEGAVS